jgi:hypothetical protein
VGQASGEPAVSAGGFTPCQPVTYSLFSQFLQRYPCFYYVEMLFHCLYTQIHVDFEWGKLEEELWSVQEDSHHAYLSLIHFFTVFLPVFHYFTLFFHCLYTQIHVDFEWGKLQGVLWSVQEDSHRAYLSLIHYFTLFFHCLCPQSHVDFEWGKLQVKLRSVQEDSHHDYLSLIHFFTAFLPVFYYFTLFFHCLQPQSHVDFDWGKLQDELRSVKDDSHHAYLSLIHYFFLCCTVLSLSSPAESCGL